MAEVAAAGADQTSPSGASATPEQHKLQNRWTFWFLHPKKPGERDFWDKVQTTPWHELLDKIYSFDTVEDFWALFNTIIPASRLKDKGEFYLFKDGVLPTKENYPGLGIWQCTLPRDCDKKFLEDNWLALAMAMVGETLDDSDDVMGAYVTIKKSGSRFNLWHKTSSNADLQKRIEERAKATLELPKDASWKYSTA